MRKPPKNKRALDVADWPGADQHAWRSIVTSAGDDLLSDPVTLRAAAWRPGSRDLFIRCYGLWLRWLQESGQLVASAKPSQRITRSRVLAYLKTQRELGSTARTLVNHAVALRHMFEVLARDCDTSWMLEVIRRLKTTVTSNKNHSDLPSIGELFEFGVRLMRAAENDAAMSAKQRALQFRNGLIIALLAARPMMRRENVARIKIGESLIVDSGAMWLVFTADEMKGGRGRQAPLPEFLAVAIERYIARHRSVLLLGRPEPDRTLFISGMGRPIYPHALAKEIGDLTQAKFGRRVNLHDFRRSAGSSIASEDPEHVGIAPSILGHVDYKTSETYYIFASDSAAFRRFETALNHVASDESE